jgi:hypothetical protein
MSRYGYVKPQYPVPEVKVSGKYKVLCGTEYPGMTVYRWDDELWIFKDDKNVRYSRKTLITGELLEEYHPIKAEEINDEGMVRLYEQLCKDARLRVDSYDRTVKSLQESKNRKKLKEFKDQNESAVNNERRFLNEMCSIVTGTDMHGRIK